MTYSAFLKFLKEKTGYVKDPGGDRDIICRCPFCGDSIKNKHKGHLYISKTLGLFHCFRCEAAGSISYLLQVLEYDGPVPFSNIRYNYVSEKKLTKLKQKRLKVPSIEEAINIEQKVRYLQSRNIIVDNETIIKYRIVLDLDQFLRMNKLTCILDNRLYQDLVSNYVGFLSWFGNKVILRNIVDTKRRYFNLALFSETLDYYVIDMLTYTSIPRIVIAEGIFDVISAVDKFGYDGVYVSVGSKPTPSILKWTMTVFGLFKPKVTIVLDRDAVEYKYRFYKFRKFVDSFEFVVPVDGKDIADAKEYAIYEG